MATMQIEQAAVVVDQFDVARQREIIRKEMAKRTFCTLATASTEMRPHVVGMRYVMIGEALYVTIHEDSVKARNIRENPRVAVCIPAKKVPFFPPFVVQFQGTATLLSVTDQRIQDLFAAGRLKGIISAKDFHEDPKTAFARIVPARRLSSYGLGVSLLQIVKTPTSAIRSVDI
jgi:nitroimidazol reductase NimA-like FMN-containing flavoprotein (pyridoxamine 5'-phosphate oxidase superfamily)